MLINNKIYGVIVWIFLFANINAYAQYIKVSSQGKVLTDNANNWSCIIDSKTNLMWEVKTTDSTINNANNSFTWFDGKLGFINNEYSRNCNFNTNCNTELYVYANNIRNLCSYDNWRLPTYKELLTIKEYPDDNPTINTDYFPNTKSKSYWSSDIDKEDNNAVLDVPFFYGGTTGSGMSFDNYIRLVRKQVNNVNK